MLTSPTIKPWQTLLIQAFKETSPSVKGKHGCRLLCLYRYIYKTLRIAGIENRSPFSYWQLIKISYISAGKPEVIRQSCIDSVTNMQKPVLGFHASTMITIMIALGVSTVFLLKPKIATTSRTIANSITVLKQTPAPIPDIDKTDIGLPTASDYLMADESISYLFPKEPSDNSSLAGTSWINRQSSNHYSLQLVSASDATQLKKYCIKYEICDQSAIYQTLINGRATVRLLYGTYPNFKAAKLAISKLPVGLQKTNPWARQFKSIQRDL